MLILISNMNYFTLIFSLIIAIACFWMSIKMIRLYLKVKKWERITATVTSKEVFIHPKYSSRRSPYGIKVSYSYSKNGVDYTGHMVYLAELHGGQANHMKATAERKLDKIESSMNIFVNPGDPKQAVMYCDGIGLYILMFIMGLLSLLVGLGNL